MNGLPEPELAPDHEVSVADGAPLDVLATTPQPTEAASHWPLWQRLMFRFLLVYYLLYALPRPLSNLLQTVAGTLGLMTGSATGESSPGWLSEGPIAWLSAAIGGLYRIEQGRQVVTTWLGAHGMAPYEVIHQPTGSGDTAHDITMVLVNVLVAGLLVGIWSLLQRRPCGYPRLGRWLHLVVRFDLAFHLLSYGSSKLYGSQFGELRLDRLTQEIGDTWPMSMVGTFMQASPAYEVLGGLGEVLGGVLLFHRRTALLGALVTLTVMGNVCALNWLCGVPVKLFSAHLWLFALFLLAPWRHALCALLVKNRSSQPVDMHVPAPGWMRWPLLIGGWGWVLATLLLMHVEGTGPKPWLQGREKSELFGVWQIERMLVDGVEVPTSDVKRWRMLAIDRGNLTWSRDANGDKLSFDFVWDATAGVAQVKQRNGNKRAAAVPWTIVQGTKLVPCDPPLVLRNVDRGKQVDGERRTLVLTGAWGDQQLELHTVEKHFRLHTGFRLRQELPDFW